MREKIFGLVEQGKYIEARNEMTGLNVVDIAQLFEEIDQKNL